MHYNTFTELGLPRRESIEKVFTKGVLEQSKNVRRILRFIDYMLKPGGEVHIKFYRERFDAGGGHFRPFSYLMYEVSLVFQNRMEVLHSEFDVVDSIILKKTEKYFPSDDSKDSWSFGIVSNGENLHRIRGVIAQIESFDIPDFEVIVCGPSDKLQGIRAKVLDDSDLFSDLRVPIGRKKNHIAEEARKNNLLILHDRISFDEDWYQNILKLESNFDAICMPVLDEDSKKHRVNDWLKSGDLYDFTTEGSLLDYSEFSPLVYMNGGVICIKRHVYQAVKIRDFLNWGEMEDVDFSKRLMNLGFDLGFYEKSILYSSTRRIKINEAGNSLSILQRLIARILRPYGRRKSRKLILNSFKKFLHSPF